MTDARADIGARAVQGSALLGRDSVIDAVECFDKVGVDLGEQDLDLGVRDWEGQDLGQDL